MGDLKAFQASIQGTASRFQSSLGDAKQPTQLLSHYSAAEAVPASAHMSSASYAISVCVFEHFCETSVNIILCAETTALAAAVRKSTLSRAAAVSVP